MEAAGLGGVIQVRPTAKLDAVVAHVDHADNIAVLFAEECCGSGLAGVLNGHLAHVDLEPAQDRRIDRVFDLPKLVRRDGGEMGKVKAEEVRLHQRARLMHMLAQHVPQRLLQQVGRAVSASDGGTALLVIGSPDRIAQLQYTAYEFSGVHDLAALVLLHVADLKFHTLRAQAAVIGHLAAHFGVQDRAVKNHDGLRPCGDLLSHFAVCHNGQYLGLNALVIVSVKHRLRDLFSEGDACPAQITQRGTGLTGAGPLLLHVLLEAVLVHGHTFIGAHLNGQIDGEAIGVVELESVRAGEGILPFCLMFGQKLRKDLHAGVNGLGKVLFLGLYHTGDIGLLFPKFGILALVFMDHRVDDLIEERFIHAQELAMTGGAAEKAAQHVAAAFVGGQDTVADHEGGGADVVGDHAQRDVHFMGFAVVGAGELADLVGNVHDRVHVKERVHVLAHDGQTLQTHAGVDVFLLEFGVMSLTVVIELREDVIPDLDISVTVAANGAAGLAAAVLLAAIIIDLRAGTAGAGAVLPEVVLLAKAEDPFRSDADLFVPDLESLVIVHINRGIQAVRIKTDPIGAGKEFPAPVDGFPLEIIAEGEIAQHLKISAVAGSLADVFDIACADALLTGAHTLARRFFFPFEIGLHRRHAGIDEQKAGVALRDQRKAGETKMSFGLKEAEEHFAQLIQSVFFHFVLQKKINLRP